MKLYKDIFIDLDNTLYDRKADTMGVPVDGALELVDYLRGKGYRLHLCSNGSTQGRMEKLHSIGLQDAFYTIITSEKAGAIKPDVEFFQYALRMSDALPETTIMIGDNNDTDIIGATAVGLDTILFNRWERDWMPPNPVTFRVNELKEIMTIL